MCVGHVSEELMEHLSHWHCCVHMAHPDDDVTVEAYRLEGSSVLILQSAYMPVHLCAIILHSLEQCALL